MSRILYVAYPLLPLTDGSAGGAEQMLLTLEGEIASRGYDTTVAACARSRVTGQLLATGDASGEPDGYEAREAEHNRRVLEHVTCRAQAGLPYDLVHDQSGSFWGQAGDVAAPVLATLHLPRNFYRAELFAEPSANLFFNCVSVAQARTFAGLPRLMGVVQNGIVAERFPFAAHKRDYLLWLGRICEEKGTDLAIRVAAQTGRRLILAGQVYPFSYHQSYFERCVQPHLESNASRVTFIPSPTLPQKLELLRHAHALLVPSLCEETSSLVSLEAMACGTPVIAFNRGSVPEVIDDGVTGFIVEDINGAIGAVDRLGHLSREKIRRRFEERFTARRMAQDYLSVYRSLSDNVAPRLRLVTEGAPAL